MRTYKFYLPALVVMLFAASASALAQQGARRNNTVTARQESQAERKQEKVNEVQKPTIVTNQPVTDQKMRTAGGSQNDRRNGSTSSGSAASSGNSGSNVSSGSNVNSGSNANRPPANNGNGGYNNGNAGNRPPANSGNGGYNNGNAGNRPPANSGNGGYNNGNSGNRPPANGGYNGNRPPVAPPPPPSNNYPGGYSYPGSRPPLPTARVYDRAQTVYRTNSSTIVLSTLFRSKEEAYRYVERLLVGSDYTIGTYGNGYSWLQSDVAFIPTPFDWTNPMTHNQFRVKVTFTRSFGYVRVTLSGEWRESMLASTFSILRFQPSDQYSTYYAWNVLEDLAESIPHSSVSYR